MLVSEIMAAAAAALPTLLQMIRDDREIEDILPLIESQKDVRDSDGKTPLHYAVDENRVDVLQELRMAGANINVADAHGITPLHIAIRNNDLPIVQILVENGADVTAQDENGKTPLMYAVENANADIVEFLLDDIEYVTADPLSLFLRNKQNKNVREYVTDPRIRQMLQEQFQFYKQKYNIEKAAHRNILRGTKAEQKIPEDVLQREILKLLIPNIRSVPRAPATAGAAVGAAANSPAGAGAAGAAAVAPAGGGKRRVKGKKTAMQRKTRKAPRRRLGTTRRSKV